MVKFEYPDKPLFRELIMAAINKLIVGSTALFFVLTITACSPEVGSDQWCADMKATPSGDWSANQASDFAKHCILK